MWKLWSKLEQERFSAIEINLFFFIALALNLVKDPIEVTKLVSMIERGQSYEEALNFHERVFGETIPEAVYDFVRDTLRTADKASTHEVMAAFLFGREDPIPKMFQSIIDNKILSDDKKLECFRLYLQRHIDVDGDDHGPLAFAALRLKILIAHFKCISIN